MKAIVIGAGIGGLSAAIALRRAGVETVVFERARELREIGAGISLTANATRALNELVLADVLSGIGTPIEVAAIRTWRGEVLSRIPVWQLSERVGAKTAAVHRADLQVELLRKLGEGVVRTGAACTSFEQASKGVRAFFADGTAEGGDLLVGADGLHSKIREGLSNDGAPRYAGYTTWRAVVTPENELVPTGEALEVWGRGVRFICAQVGRGRVYWAVSKNAPEEERDVSVEGVKDVLLDLCAGWLEPVEDLISATNASTILRTDVYDRDPPNKRWGEGRVTLLGDAAHPMTPDLGQGACQAIEDAVALANHLSRQTTGDVAAVLELYETRRVRRTAAIVRGSRRTGQVAQLQNPLLCLLRNAALKALPSRLQMKQLEAIVGYEE
jgi:2-polyprenyl-6-methoxyphenol hydroxylase-like FAD-dependent oxidoreductase